MSRPMLGSAQLPSKAHPMGVAVCGMPIVPGLIVWTNEYRPGKVLASDRHDPEWFDVEYIDGRKVMQNGERVATTFEGKSARKEWDRLTGPTKARDVDHRAVTDIAAILGDLGSKITEQYSTPGACGYTRITYTLPKEKA